MHFSKYGIHFSCEKSLNSIASGIGKCIGRFMLTTLFTYNIFAYLHTALRTEGNMLEMN